MNEQAIRSFVKGILGCTCPDEVFKDITCEVNATVLQCQDPVSRIELGDRLLIYLLITDKPEILERDLPVIIQIGKQERDRCGFNRFRTVVCANNIGAITHLADDVFARDTEKDEKVHLHVVAWEHMKDIFKVTTRD